MEITIDTVTINTHTLTIEAWVFNDGAWVHRALTNEEIEALHITVPHRDSTG